MDNTTFPECQQLGDAAEGSSLYIYSFPSAMTAGLIKIGWTRRDPFRRVKEQVTAMFEQPVLLVILWTRYAARIEENVHRQLQEFRHEGPGQEWFRVSVDKAIEISVFTILDVTAQEHYEVAQRLKYWKRCRDDTQRGDVEHKEREALQPVVDEVIQTFSIHDVVHLDFLKAARVVRTYRVRQEALEWLRSVRQSNWGFEEAVLAVYYDYCCLEGLLRLREISSRD